MSYHSARKLVKTLATRIKKAGVKRKGNDEPSKRRRVDDDDLGLSSDDPDDSDYVADVEVESSVGQHSEYVVEEDTGLHQGGAGMHPDIIDIYSHTAPRKVWQSKEYARVRNINAFSQRRDTNNMFFHTLVQEDAFFGHLLTCTLWAHKRIDFNYLVSKPVLAHVAVLLERLRLRNFMEHQCDWNETLVRQFYATFELDIEEQSIEWMTGQSRYIATFREFAAANQLDYDYFYGADSLDVYKQDLFEECQQFYEPARIGIPVKYGTPTGLRHHPAAINRIIRHTFMPKSGNKDKIREFYWNVIHYIMTGTKFNVVKMIFELMDEKRMSLAGNIYFAPYIMSLIKVKCGYNGPCEVHHGWFQPFVNAKDFLNRPLTPYDDCDDEAADPIIGDEIPADVEMDMPEMPPPPPPMQPQGFWVPPEGYFTPYFEAMQQGLQQQMMTQFQGFQQEYRTDMATLTAQFDGLSTSYQQVVDRQTQLEGHLASLSTAFTDFSDHFYSIYPRPPPPPPQDE